MDGFSDKKTGIDQKHNQNIKYLGDGLLTISLIYFYI